MPAENERIVFERDYSLEEFDRLQAGLVPKEMEDHWFIYFEEPYLYLHRSWTGFCIYRVRFESRTTQVCASELVVNRRMDQYRGLPDEARHLGILLDTQAGRDTRDARLRHVRDLLDGARTGDRR